MNTARWEDLQIKDDFMFGVIMSNPEICRLTLERILGVPIERVEYPEKQKYIAVARGRHNYTFHSYCQQDQSLQLGDRTTKIFLNTKGTMDDVDEDVKRFLRFIDKASEPDPSDELLVKMHRELLAVRLDEKWKVEYMKYQLELDAQYKRGKQDGIAQGQQQEKFATAKRMLAQSSFTDDMILLVTGITSEELQTIRNE